MSNRALMLVWLVAVTLLWGCGPSADSQLGQLTPTVAGAPSPPSNIPIPPSRTPFSAPESPVPPSGAPIPPSDSSGCQGWIAFIFRDKSEISIRAIRADGSALTDIVADPGSTYSLDLSPDGTRVAYVAQKDGKHGVYVADRSGQVRSVGIGGYGSELSWSADGTQILMSAWRGQGTELYVVDANGDTPRQLTNSWSHKTGPTWSPDGEWIAFTMLDAYNQGEIWVMSASRGADAISSEAVNLTQNPAHDCCAAWSPDGARLAFLSSRTDQGAGVARGGAYAAYRWTEKLVRMAYGASPLAQANVPYALTTVMSEQPRDIYVMARDGSGLSSLTSGEGREWDPAWSPDGRRLAYVSDRDGGQEIYLVNADSGSTMRLTRNSWSDSYPVWSPDGACLAFVSYREGAHGIYLLTVPAEPGAQPGEPWKLVDGGTYGGGLDWAP